MTVVATALWTTVSCEDTDCSFELEVPPGGGLLTWPVLEDRLDIVAGVSEQDRLLCTVGENTLGEMRRDGIYIRVRAGDAVEIIGARRRQHSVAGSVNESTPMQPPSDEAVTVPAVYQTTELDTWHELLLAYLRWTEAAESGSRRYRRLPGTKRQRRIMRTRYRLHPVTGIFQIRDADTGRGRRLLGAELAARNRPEWQDVLRTGEVDRLLVSVHNINHDGVRRMEDMVRSKKERVRRQLARSASCDQASLSTLSGRPAERRP
jgi:hypothetical protein